MAKAFSPGEHIKKLSETKGPLSERKDERDAWGQLLEQRKREEGEQGFSDSNLFEYRDDERIIAVVPMEVKFWKTEEEALAANKAAARSSFRQYVSYLRGHSGLRPGKYRKKGVFNLWLCKK